MVFSILTFVIFLAVMVIIFIPEYADRNIDKAEEEMRGSGKKLVDFAREWRSTARQGRSHYHGVALTELICEARLEEVKRQRRATIDVQHARLQRAFAMTSIYHNQSVRLLMQLNPICILFHLRASKWQEEILRILDSPAGRKGGFKKALSSVKLELLWSPSFVRALVVPSGLRTVLAKKVIAHHVEALELARKEGSQGTLPYGLIAAKLFRLTGEDVYLKEVDMIPIERGVSDPAAVERLSRILCVDVAVLWGGRLRE